MADSDDSSIGLTANEVLGVRDDHSPEVQSEEESVQAPAAAPSAAAAGAPLPDLEALTQQLQWNSDACVCAVCRCVVPHCAVPYRLSLLSYWFLFIPLSSFVLSVPAPATSVATAPTTNGGL